MDVTRYLHGHLTRYLHGRDKVPAGCDKNFLLGTCMNFTRTLHDFVRHLIRYLHGHDKVPAWTPDKVLAWT